MICQYGVVIYSQLVDISVQTGEEATTYVMREGEQPDNFCLITGGQVEVVLHDPVGHEIELLRSGPRIATIRAGQNTIALIQAIRRWVHTSTLLL